jgi:hypothetical protein
MCLRDIVSQNGVDDPAKERLLFVCTSDTVCLEFTTCTQGAVHLDIFLVLRYRSG